MKTTIRRRVRNAESERRILDDSSAEYIILFNGTGTQKGFVNSKLEDKGRAELSLDDVLLDCERYRLVFRDIANATNERSLIATVIPPGIVCHNKAPVIRPHTIEPSEDDLGDSPLHSVFERIFTDRELFTALGLLNSIPFDYLVRTKLDTSMSVYVLEESQMPRLTDGDDWFQYISERSARLNSYGEAFEEMRNRWEAFLQPQRGLSEMNFKQRSTPQRFMHTVSNGGRFSISLMISTEYIVHAL